MALSPEQISNTLAASREMEKKWRMFLRPAFFPGVTREALTIDLHIQSINLVAEALENRSLEYQLLCEKIFTGLLHHQPKRSHFEGENTAVFN